MGLTDKRTIFLLGFFFLWLPVWGARRSLPDQPASPQQFTATFIVSNTQDSGPGTFQQAILDVNAVPGPSSIVFDIPPTDPNFVGYQDDTVSGTFDPDLPIVPVNNGHDPDGPLWWRVKIETDMLSITRDGTLIDGSSQRFLHGDTNPYGPEVEIVRVPGIERPVGLYYGVHFEGDDNQVQELIINNFYPVNLFFEGNHNQLRGSYLGIEPSGSGSTAHTSTAKDNLRIHGDGNIIGGLAEKDRNLVSGRGQSGIFTQGSYNQIVGNYVGVNRQATEIVGGALSAIHIWAGGYNRIDHNVIGGGAVLMFPGGGVTRIQNNYIGTDPSGNFDLAGLTDFGAVDMVSSYNVVGPGNVIKNHQLGIIVRGSSAVRNTITQNAISNNDRKGIDLFNGNNHMPAPIITFIGAGYVRGSAPPQATIEIFSDPGDEGWVYEGVTQADSQGHFTWYGFPQGPNVTATATDSNGNTSEFSAPHPAFKSWIPIIKK